FFFSSRRRHTRSYGDWSSDVCSSDLTRAAWLILQHAIGNPPLVRRGLTLLQGGASKGEVSPLEVAMLEDRIRTFEGRPQRYGTRSEERRVGKEWRSQWWRED